MLLTTPLKEGEIVSFKLLTTEEVLATYVREDADTFYFKKAFTIGITNQGTLGIQPLLLGFDPKSFAGEWAIYKSAIAVKPMRTPPELSTDYKRITTDLVIPNKPGLITS